MSKIRCIYLGVAPDFPATDQHPDALRFGPMDVDGETVFVDVLGEAPSIDEIRAVLHPPQTVIDYATFRLRWTDAEKAALHTARAASWQIDDFIGLAQANGNIDLSIAADAKAAIVAAGILSQARGDVVFAAEVSL